MASTKLTLVERLERLQKQERKAKDDVSRLEGALEELMGQLKEQFGFESVKEAKQKFNLMTESLKVREERAERLLTELEEYL